jgi:hypothetical protein
LGAETVLALRDLTEPRPPAAPELGAEDFHTGASGPGAAPEGERLSVYVDSVVRDAAPGRPTSTEGPVSAAGPRVNSDPGAALRVERERSGARLSLCLASLKGLASVLALTGALALWVATVVYLNRDSFRVASGVADPESALAALRQELEAFSAYAVSTLLQLGGVGMGLGYFYVGRFAVGGMECALTVGTALYWTLDACAVCCPHLPGMAEVRAAQAEPPPNGQTNNSHFVGRRHLTCAVVLWYIISVILFACKVYA